jgi:hypothetical protein
MGNDCARLTLRWLNSLLSANLPIHIHVPSDSFRHNVSIQRQAELNQVFLKASLNKLINRTNL